MSTTYTGDDTATQAPSPLPAKNATPILTLPVDGDGLNVASIYQALKSLADGIDFVFDRTAVLSVANQFADLQDFVAGIQTTTSPTTLTPLLKGAGTSPFRLYVGNARAVLAFNAAYNDTTGKWSCTDTGAAAFAFAYAGVYCEFWKHTATASTWNDGTGAGAWTQGPYFDLSNGHIAATGSLFAAAEMQAGTHIRSTGAAPGIAANANLGGAGASVNIAGNDLGGVITLTAGAGAAAGIQATITFAVTYGAGHPLAVALSPANAAAWGLAANQMQFTAVAAGGASFDVTNAGGGAAALPAGTFAFNYIVTG